METTLSFSQKFSLHRGVPFLLVTTLFLLPMSSSGKSIGMALSVVAILLSPSYRSELAGLFAKPWCKAALILFGIALLACFWSPANFSERFFVVEKYSKLLYLPLLVVGFRDAKTRKTGLHAFLCAIFITCALSILKFHGFLQSLAIDPDNVFRNHIITGFMVAFATYLSLLLAYRHQGLKGRIAYVLLAAIYSYQELFINIGRTGYVVYLLMMGILVLQLCSWRQAIAGILLISSAFTLAYFKYPLINEHVNSIAKELNRYQNNDKNSAVGYRLQFHDFAHKLFNQHPVFGNGTGSFTYYFRTEKPVPAWGPKLLEPHNQYWLVAAEFGIVGFAALLFLFVSLIRASWQLNTTRAIAFAMLIPFLLGNLSDSLLFYSGSGYFFLLFMALCLGERVRPEKELGNTL
ncbi:O-antigen ligase family protein [Legionella donaldsonii]|uniref:O-antigen ligase family protein n=1 Tax=Legionella donaldsonii TaxID=45060 RepID=UPI00399CA781